MKHAVSLHERMAALLDRTGTDTIDATPAQFRRHVETLARSGTLVAMDALLEGLDGAEVPPNPIMITFDDRYRSCRDVALPILEPRRARDVLHRDRVRHRQSIEATLDDGWRAWTRRFCMATTL